MKNNCKPVFFSKLFAIISSVISIISAIGLFLFPINNLKLTFRIIIVCSIIFLIIFIYLIIHLVRLTKYYKNIEDNRDGLINDNKIQKNKNKKLENELKSKDEIINEVLTYLNYMSLQPNGYEKQCINSLFGNIKAKVNALNRNGD